MMNAKGFARDCVTQCFKITFQLEPLNPQLVDTIIYCLYSGHLQKVPCSDLTGKLLVFWKTGG